MCDLRRAGCRWPYACAALHAIRPAASALPLIFRATRHSRSEVLGLLAQQLQTAAFFRTPDGPKFFFLARRTHFEIAKIQNSREKSGFLLSAGGDPAVVAWGANFPKCCAGNVLRAHVRLSLTACENFVRWASAPYVVVSRASTTIYCVHGE